MKIKALGLVVGAILFAVAAVGIATESDMAPKDAVSWWCPPSCT